MNAITKTDKNIRVVVLSGAGGKAFVSGADISKFENERSSKEAVDRYNVAVEKANSAVLIEEAITTFKQELSSRALLPGETP